MNAAQRLAAGLVCLLGTVAAPDHAMAADPQTTTPESRNPRPAQLQELDAKLAAAREAVEALLLQVRESATALQPFYRERPPAGDAAAQRALLEALADPTHVPSPDELSRLFINLQLQLDALGSTSIHREPVYRPDGRVVERDVLHIGGFGWVADGRYLVYQPEADKLVELTRQPAAGLLALASQYMSTSSESLAAVAVDPSGGQTLQLVVQIPNLGERIRQGGPVGYLILALGLTALALSGYRFSKLHRDEQGIRRQLNRAEPRPDNPLGRILTRLKEAPGTDAETLNLAADQALLTEQERLERSLPMLRLLAAIAPMLGLLGTVSGMIATFQAIALHGSGDPKLMSAGISEALVTTVEGLVTAIPILLLHSLLVSKSARLASLLEAQSAATIARRLDAAGAEPPDRTAHARSPLPQPLGRAI